MKCAIAVAMAALASGAWTAGGWAASAWAAETKSFSYTCKGGRFTVTASLDSAGRWSRTEPVILQIADEPPQTLTADPDAPDADSYRNKDYEFYSLKAFTTLTRKSHGVTVKFYSACRAAADVR